MGYLNINPMLYGVLWAHWATYAQVTETETGEKRG